MFDEGKNKDVHDHLTIEALLDTGFDGEIVVLL